MSVLITKLVFQKVFRAKWKAGTFVPVSENPSTIIRYALHIIDCFFSPDSLSYEPIKLLLSNSMQWAWEIMLLRQSWFLKLFISSFGIFHHVTTFTFSCPLSIFLLQYCGHTVSSSSHVQCSIDYLLLIV